MTHNTGNLTKSYGALLIKCMFTSPNSIWSNILRVPASLKLQKSLISGSRDPAPINLNELRSKDSISVFWWHRPVKGMTCWRISILSWILFNKYASWVQTCLSDNHYTNLRLRLAKVFSQGNSGRTGFSKVYPENAKATPRIVNCWFQGSPTQIPSIPSHVTNTS